MFLLNPGNKAQIDQSGNLTTLLLEIGSIFLNEMRDGDDNAPAIFPF